MKYVCRAKDAPNPTPNADFLDDYVAMAPMVGEAFTIDSSEVFTLLVKFIAGNETAEAKIQPHVTTTNGRLAFKALKDHYEGVGVHSIDIMQADEVLDSLFYTGEKKPHMWWGEFEKQLTSAFISYDKKEKRQVFSDQMKLRILIKKINADFLSSAKAGIGIELTRTTVTMTYEQALQMFRDVVNLKFPPELGGKRSRRHINEMSGRGGRNGRGGRGGQGGRGGRGGRGRGGNKRTRPDSTMITLTNGKQIEFHPSFNFSGEIYGKMRQEDKDNLRNLRTEHKRQRQIQSIGQYNNEMAYPNSQQNYPNQNYQRFPQYVSQPSYNQIQSTTMVPPPPPPPPPPARIDAQLSSQVSQVSAGSTFMGGRNEQSHQAQGSNRG